MLVAYPEPPEYEEHTCVTSRIDQFSVECKEFQLINSGEALEFLDTGLEPLTLYEYRLCVNNSFGDSCREELLRVETLKTLPLGFEFFSYKRNEEKLVFTWNTPIQLNDRQIFYRVYRDGEVIYKGEQLYFVERIASLRPYQAYKYEVNKTLL